MQDEAVIINFLLFILMLIITSKNRSIENWEKYGTGVQKDNMKEI